LLYHPINFFPMCLLQCQNIIYVFRFRHVDPMTSKVRSSMKVVRAEAQITAFIWQCTKFRILGRYECAFHGRVAKNEGRANTHLTYTHACYTCTHYTWARIAQWYCILGSEFVLSECSKAVPFCEVSYLFGR